MVAEASFIAEGRLLKTERQDLLDTSGPSSIRE
jgi:hypothetical protein